MELAEHLLWPDDVAFKNQCELGLSLKLLNEFFCSFAFQLLFMWFLWRGGDCRWEIDCRLQGTLWPLQGRAMEFNGALTKLMDIYSPQRVFGTAGTLHARA
ncbi:hypothetical protein K402DRAFT_178726 [Aulographum hederae CBS 113979]|uniref:Uncharacterized protein n=1 Tax=Aulographum hederae CBS 113979 TaxID=1176131 RepID=A0A6G1GQ99_9PEZI|nr:hypothetical protein K402DRAFT_178726 [Aulographum hederae CBS 113979]